MISMPSEGLGRSGGKQILNLIIFIHIHVLIFECLTFSSSLLYHLVHNVQSYSNPIFVEFGHLNPSIKALLSLI